ncbi:MAG: hypothetical protein F8N38_03785 [Hungatella sp.]|nr:hypothetical protein [Hungatella sp.]
MSEEKGVRSPNKIITELTRNYIQLEESLVNQLNIKISNHYYTSGTYREEVWKSLLEMIIPKKYCIEQGVFIIDSNMKISREVDLAIFDETYTPYIFNYGKIKFIPIEAVAVVVQCKSNITVYNNKENAEEEEKNEENNKEDVLLSWSKSIDRLKTSPNSFCRTMTDLQDNLVDQKPRTQTATRPLKLLCALSISDKALSGLEEDFDFILHCDSNAKRLKKVVKNETSNYADWYYSINHYNEEKKWEKPEEIEKNKIREVKYNENRILTNLQVKDGNGNESVIMSLTFQLNQLLMIINNPMLFPHAAYVDSINDIIKKEGLNFSK